MHDRYLPLVDRCGTRSEFSDLLWEMQGELGTSHCYEMGGDYRPGPAWMHGLLGADLDWDRRRHAWKITRIPRGDSWDPKSGSPLAAPGLNIQEGDEILEVAGLPVTLRSLPTSGSSTRQERRSRSSIRKPARQRSPRPARADARPGRRRGPAAPRGKCARSS